MCHFVAKACVWEPSCWINVTLGYPHAPQHINHRDTFMTLLIRQGPQRTPSNIPSHPNPTPSLSLSQSQGSAERAVGEAELEVRREGVCVRVCEVRPPHSEASPGTTAGTRLLLGLGTVAPQEQQKTPLNAPCSSSVNSNTYTWNQAAAHKHTTYASSKPTAFS